MERARHLLQALERQFKVLKVTQGNKHNYLPMVFEYKREEKTVKVTMPKYASKIADSYETSDRGTPLTPHTSTLFKVQESVKLNREEQENPQHGYEDNFYSMYVMLTFYHSEHD